ncbi:phage tail tape measure protein [Georgenia muralis]
MADRTVAVRLKAEVSSFKASIQTAQKATEDFVAKGLDKVATRSAAIDDLSMKAGVAGAALTAMAGASVLAFADFDQAMSNVAATGDDARGSLDALREAAIEAGARTAFSASEAAGAIEELAKAGVSAEDILGGGLDGALDLAAAGGLAVADAAGIAATAMQQFSLDGGDMTHVADLMAAAAGKAMGDVDEMGQALNQAGLVAAQTGLSIEETTGALASFASAGLLGSDAGTSLKTMLQRLTPQSAEAAEQFEALGISAYDANGNFVGLSDFAGQLETAMADLSPEARNAAMSVMFGSDAVRAASVLYSEGEAGIREWITAVDDQGYAAETAAVKLDNLKGDWEALTGSLETALINAGEGADGPLRSLTQGATNLVNMFSDLPPVVQQGTTAITGAGGLALLGTAGLGKMLTTAVETRDALRNIGISARTAGLAVGGVTGILGAATVGVTLYANAQSEAEEKARTLADTLDEQTGALTENSTAWISSELTKDQSFGIRNTQSMAEAAEQMGISLETLTRAYEGQPAAMEEAKRAAQEYADNNRDVGLANASLSDRFIRNIDDQNERLETARGIQEAKLEIDREAGDAQGSLAGEYDLATAAMGAQIISLEELLGLQREAAGVVLSERDAQRALEAAYDDATGALEENGATLDITTDAGRRNEAALDDIAQASWTLIEAMQENGATADDLRGKTQTARDEFIRTATQMGMTEDAARALADEYGLIPEKILTEAELKKAQAEADLDALAAKIRNLPNGVVSIETVGYAQTYGYLSNLQSLANSLRNNPVRIATGAGGSGGLTFADGGMVPLGFGGPTQDNVPILASSGEYIIKADTVQRYGRGFFDAVNAQRFATGGPVGVAPSVNVTAPAMSLEGLRIEGNIQLGNGLEGYMRGVIRNALTGAGVR